VCSEKVNEDRLYRALDALLPHKSALEKHLKEKLGELFELDYDLLLYDVTSTYFEGQAEKNRKRCGLFARPSAGLQAGQHRPGGERCGMPLATRFSPAIATTHNAERDGRAHRRALWPGQPDLGHGPRMAGEDNVEFLREGAGATS